METDVRRGRALAQELLAGEQLEERSEHDCIYLLSVALYRAGRLLDARRQLDELLKVRASGWAHHAHPVFSAGSSTRHFCCVSAKRLRRIRDTRCVRRESVTKSCRARAVHCSNPSSGPLPRCARALCVAPACAKAPEQAPCGPCHGTQR